MIRSKIYGEVQCMEIKKSLVLDAEEPLSKAVSELMDGRTAVIVTKGGRYYGIVDDRHVRQGIADPGRTRVETVAVKSPVLAMEASLLDCVDAFLSGHFKALPVVGGDGKPVGITTRVEVMKGMLDAGLVPRRRVSELMSSPVYTIEESESIAKAKGLMKEREANRLVVTRRGMPVGAISTLDFMASERESRAHDHKPKVMKENETVMDRPIAEYLRTDITSVEEASTIDEAVKKMVAKEVSSVLVLSGKRPVGVFTAIDLFKSIQDFAKEDVEVSLSGLEGDSRQYYPTIREGFASVLRKFMKSFDISNAAVHVKEGKKTYVMQVSVETGEGRISLSHERYAIKELTDELCSELDRALRTMKEKRKAKVRRVHGGKEEL